MDQTLIGKMAAAHIKAATIEDFDENSVVARNIRIFYDAARLETLEAFDWNFARKRVSLALLEEAPPSQWGGRYSYPANCAKARYISTYGIKRPAIPIPFDVELNAAGTAKTILTDVASPELVFTMDVTNPALFSAAYANALSWRIAANIAKPITGNDSDEQRCFKNWQYFSSIGEANDANESQEEINQPDGEFITSRA